MAPRPSPLIKGGIGGLQFGSMSWPAGTSWKPSLPAGIFERGRVVDISSDVSARVTQLLVREGDDVTAGQLLLRLDPTQFEASVSRTEALLNQSRTQARQQEANVERVTRDFQRLIDLFHRDSLMVARQLLDDAETEVELASHQLESLRFGVDQAVASLDEANETPEQDHFSGAHLRKSDAPQRGRGRDRHRRHDEQPWKLGPDDQ